MNQFVDVFSDDKNVEIMHDAKQADDRGCLRGDGFDDIGVIFDDFPRSQRHRRISQVGQIIPDEQHFVDPMAQILMSRNQFRHENVAVPVTDLPDDDYDIRRDRQINHVRDDVEIHDASF
jgi:hypothetical protein